MLKDLFSIHAFANPSGSRGSQRSGVGTIVRDASQRRRGQESMGAYYRRTGTSMLGASSRTRGTAARVVGTNRRGPARQ